MSFNIKCNQLQCNCRTTINANTDIRYSKNYTLEGDQFKKKRFQIWKNYKP